MNETTYGQMMQWHDGYGRQRIEVSGCSSLEEARASALHMALASGWTPPRWWQWWRWQDPAYPWAATYSPLTPPSARHP